MGTGGRLRLGMRMQDFFRSVEGREECWSVVVAPLTTGTPAKIRQFDDGFTVWAHDSSNMRPKLTALPSVRRSDERWDHIAPYGEVLS